MKRLTSLFLAALLAFAPVAQADLRASSGAFGPATITTGTGLWSDGTNSIPSFAYASDTATGFYRISSGRIGVAGTATAGIALDAANGFMQVGSGGVYGWSNASTTSSTYDLALRRDAANTLALSNGNTAQEFRVYAGNGGFISNVKTVTESLTIAAVATTVGATTIPAGAILLGVSVRVTTVIPTAATFTVTTTVGGTTLNTAAVSVAAGSTDPGTAAGASFRAAATTVTITPTLSPATATGVVRLQYYYLQITPATS